MNKHKEVTCNKCGWVAFAITRNEAEQHVKNFISYINTLSDMEQNEYKDSTAARIARYEQCYNCGNNYNNFHDAKPDDCPAGSTIQAIIIGDDNGHE